MCCSSSCKPCVVRDTRRSIPPDAGRKRGFLPGHVVDGEHTAAFSATMIMEEFVLSEVVRGITDASATRRSAGWNADDEPSVYGLLVARDWLGGTAAVARIKADWRGRSLRIDQSGNTVQGQNVAPVPAPRINRPAHRPSCNPLSARRRHQQPHLRRNRDRAWVAAAGACSMLAGQQKRRKPSPGHCTRRAFPCAATPPMGRRWLSCGSTWQMTLPWQPPPPSVREAHRRNAGCHLHSGSLARLRDR